MRDRPMCLNVARGAPALLQGQASLSSGGPRPGAEKSAGTEPGDRFSGQFLAKC